MKFVCRLYQYFNILSLDVVAGAILSALFFSRLFENNPGAQVFVALGLTVWIIYTLDHLRDARNIHGVASTDRHRFHQLHFRAIIIGVSTAVVLLIIVVPGLPHHVLKAGVVLGIAVSLYLVLQRYLKFMKEFFVAILYTAGILLPSLSALDEKLLVVHYIIIGKFAITALMNLLLFSLIDLEVDRSQQQNSFVTWFGQRSSNYAILLLGTINIISGLLLWAFNTQVAIIFIAMNMVLLALLFLKQDLIRNNYYRIAGDAIFFIPGIFLL